MARTTNWVGLAVGVGAVAGGLYLYKTGKLAPLLNAIPGAAAVASLASPTPAAQPAPAAAAPTSAIPATASKVWADKCVFTDGQFYYVYTTSGQVVKAAPADVGQYTAAATCPPGIAPAPAAANSTTGTTGASASDAAGASHLAGGLGINYTCALAWWTQYHRDPNTMSEFTTWRATQPAKSQCCASPPCAAPGYP